MHQASQLSREIERKVPALSATLHTPACEQSIYRQLGALSDYATAKVDTRDLPEVKRTFRLVEDLYMGGSAAIRHGIENVFVFSISRMLSLAGRQKDRVLALIPMMLFTLYLRQVQRRGC